MLMVIILASGTHLVHAWIKSLRWLMHHVEGLDRLIGRQMVINLRVMISQHSRNLLSIVSLGSYKRIVVITFSYRIHVVHTWIILILHTIIDRW